MPRSTRKNASSQATANDISRSDACSEDTDFSAVPFSELVSAILDRNTDPVMGKMLRALTNRIPLHNAEKIEEEKRGRSVVISGIAEAPSSLPPSSRQKDLEEKVFQVLDALDLECRPTEIRRMLRPETNRARLVKVVFSTKQEWSQALAKARLLRPVGFKDIYLRRSMTELERKKEFELRQQARERNMKLGKKEWVVHRGELKRASEISMSQNTGNSQ